MAQITTEISIFTACIDLEARKVLINNEKLADWEEYDVRNKELMNAMMVAIGKAVSIIDLGYTDDFYPWKNGFFTRVNECNVEKVAAAIAHFHGVMPEIIRFHETDGSTSLVIMAKGYEQF